MGLGLSFLPCRKAAAQGKEPELDQRETGKGLVLMPGRLVSYKSVC